MNTVQILGAAPNLSLAPPIFTERWCCNAPKVYRVKMPEALTTWTRWFNFHSKAHIMNSYPYGYNYYKEQLPPRRIYLQEAQPDIPTSITFPRHELQTFFGTPGQPETFFTFSGCWLLAFAIHQHLTVTPIDRVELWGFELKRAHQYDYERPGIHYWIGRARQAGIDVYIPPEVDVCRAEKIYGYQTS